jgi:hypothetical protein
MKSALVNCPVGMCGHAREPPTPAKTRDVLESAAACQFATTYAERLYRDLNEIVNWQVSDHAQRSRRRQG